MPRMSIAFPKDREDAKKIQNKPIDESVATPTDGDILVYRDAGADWVLESKPAGGSNPAINDVTDVTITTPADNEVLAYDSTSGEWINQTPDEASLADLSGAQTLTNKTINADNNTISNIGIAEFDTDTADTWNLMNGAALDSPAVSVSSNGTVITLSLEQNGGGDIRFVFSDGIHTHDCTPADTVTLTAGSDTSPQINYIYILQSNKTLTNSTSGFPSGVEYAPIATVLCQSATSLQTDGAYKVHAWTDHVAGSASEGHLAHLNYWIRQQPATWIDGVACTPTGGASNFDIATSSGNVLQLHPHAFPAFNTATGSDIYVVNNSTTAYNKVTDLSSETNDANGTALQAWYSVVIWGVVNEDSSDCKLMCNLPTGSYLNNSGNRATNDDGGYSVYTIPSVFTGTGFLIARVTVSVSGGTYTIEETEDLRGQFPSLAAGGNATNSVEFADNVFRIQDESDSTKELAFQVSGVTTATTRTLTVPDANGTIQLQPSEGGFADGDKTKLDGIETGADLTDTANVTAAGALMDSEVDADLKTLSLPANTTISTFGASLVDDADASAARTTLGVDASGTVNATLTKSITIESPDNAEDISMFYTPIAITVTEMVAVLVGSSTPSVTWTVRHSTDRSAAGNQVVTGGTTTTSTTTGSVVTSFNDATIPADSFVWVETTAQSGTVDQIQISVQYTED